MKSTILLTGANRGIGLALTGHLLRRGHRVIATCRDVAAASELRTLAADVHTVDITSDSSVATLAGYVKSKYAALDVLVNNAGVFLDRANKSIDDLDLEQLAATLETNLFGPARLTQALWPLLRLGINPRVVNISAGAGLISTKRNSNYYSYSISKAALNMFTRLLEMEGRAQSICVVAVTPGRVQTRMGDPDAPLTPDETAASLAAMVEGLKMSDTGVILDRNGKACFDATFTDGTGRVCRAGW